MLRQFFRSYFVSVGQQVEGRHQAPRRKAFAPEIGHVDHPGMRHGRIVGHRHQGRGFGPEPRVVGPHGIDVQTEREPADARHIEELVPRKTPSDPLSGFARNEVFRIVRLVFVASGDIDGREMQFGTAAGIEELVERIAGDPGPQAEEREARMVGVVGEQHVRIVAVVDVSGVGAQRQEAAVGQRHPHARRKEALAVLDLLGVADPGDVAEIAVAEIPDREIVGVIEE